MTTYKGNYQIKSYSEDFIKQVANSLKAEFIYSKGMDMFGIKYQGIDIYFYDTLVAVADENENTEKVYSSMSDIEHQIDYIERKNYIESIGGTINKEGIEE